MGLFSGFRKKKTAGQVVGESIDAGIAAAGQAVDATVQGAKDLAAAGKGLLNRVLLASRLDVLKTIVTDAFKGSDAPTTAAVTVVFDKSGSAKPLYQSGKMQELLERLLPLGMQFDDNGAFDMYSFSSKQHAKYHGEVDEHNAAEFIERDVLPQPYGLTYYAPVIDMIVEKAKGSKIPTYVVFITDGDCDDRAETKMSMIAASDHPVFFKFIGIGNASSFGFLQDLDDMSDRTIDNADFFQANDLAHLTDEDLYKKMMVEYPSWCVEAKAKGIL